MGASVRLGRIRGVVVGLHWSVLGILVLIVVGLGATTLPAAVDGYRPGEYWGAAVITGIVFLGSILAHEVSHALVALREGVRVNNITLWLLGGAAQLEGRVPSAGAELRIALAGPAVSIGIGVIGGAVAVGLDGLGASPLLVATISWLAGINLVLAIFNLIPAAPLDGGRVLQAALWAWRKDRTWATVVAAQAGRVFGSVLIALGVVLFLAGGAGGLWFVLLGWFLVNIARAEATHATLDDALEGITVGMAMTPDPLTAPADITVDEFLDRYVMRHRHASFPLVEPTGEVCGLLTLRRLREQPAMGPTPIGHLATPLSAVPTSTSSEPLLDAMERIDERAADGRMLVFDDNRLVGILSPVDVRRAVDVRSMRRRSLDAPPASGALRR